MLGGDIEQVAAQDRLVLEELIGTPDPADRPVAVDLGCGPGPQTLALADMGFASVARTHGGPSGVDQGIVCTELMVTTAESIPGMAKRLSTATEVAHQVENRVEPC